MIEGKHKVIIISIIAGAAFWLVDAILDTLIFYRMPFGDLLITHVPPHEVYIRTFTAVSFILFGLLLSRYLAKIKDSEGRFHQLFDSINDAVFVLPIGNDKEPGRFIEVNKEACARLGYTREELLGLSPQDVNVSEDVRQIPLRADKLLANGHVLFETVHLAKDGRQIPVEVNAHLVEFKGKPTILAIARDITARRRDREALQQAHEELEQRVQERTAELLELNRQLLREMEEHRQTEAKLRESEQRFRTLFQTAGSVIILLNTEGAILEFNAEAEKTFGWSRDEIVGQSAIELLVPEMVRDDAEMGKQKILAGLVAKGREFALRLRDGRERLFLWNVNPLYDGQGQISGIVAVGHDITERKQAEKALKESEQALRYLTSQLLTVQEDERRRISQELHEEMGQTLLGMKLRLSSIRDKLRKGKPRKDQKSIIADCDQLAQYLQAMVDNIRKLSRDLSPAILEDLGLSAAIKNLVDEFCKTQADFQSCAFELDNIDGVLSRRDQINIYRICQESLSNIAKHSDASQLQLAIKREADRLSFLLADNGKGFDPKGFLVPQPGGKGLGLATLDERVRLLGGTLQIESQTGAGTRVRFEVPLKEMAEGSNGPDPEDLIHRLPA